jgi:ABC-2 type transport system ATP-binding protein
MTAIEVKELTKFWGQTLAVDNISFAVDSGEIFGFLGPNGAGKTTTIKMLVGLTRPSKGSAIVAGYDVVKESTEVKKRIGVVPEASNLYDELTVNENLTFISKLYHLTSGSGQARIKDLLDIFQLNEYRNRSFGKLSKGLKRRTVLAAALIHKPQIIFMDEPTSGLDIMSARNLRQVIEGLAKEGITIFLTTHYIEEAGQLCNRIALLVNGRIIEIESPNVLRSRVQETPLLNIEIENEVELADLIGIPAEDIQVNSGKISILTHDIHGSLSAFMKLADDRGFTIREIQTVKPRLEDAFIKLTGLTLESMKSEKEARR